MLTQLAISAPDTIRIVDRDSSSDGNFYVIKAPTSRVDRIAHRRKAKKLARVRLKNLHRNADVVYRVKTGNGEGSVANPDH